jgi:hypothetical protein
MPTKHSGILFFPRTRVIYFKEETTLYGVFFSNEQQLPTIICAAIGAAIGQVALCRVDATTLSYQEYYGITTRIHFPVQHNLLLILLNLRGHAN